jgi:stage III sporulation protein AC
VKTHYKEKIMGIDLIFRIAAIGILVSVLNVILKKSDKEEMAMMTTLAGLCIVLMMIVKELATLFDTIKTIFQF